jgi:hypothetical protein
MFSEHNKLQLLFTVAVTSKIKVNFALEQAIMTEMGSTRIAMFFL